MPSNLLKSILIFMFILLISVQKSFAIDFEKFTHKNPIAIQDVKYLNQNKQPSELSDLRGKVIVLNFWATWCAPCVKEMPLFDSLTTKIAEKGLSNKIEILPISLDFKGVETVEDFYKENKIENLPVFVDKKGESFRKFSLKALPTTVIIDKKGLEIARILGEMQWDSDAVIDYLITQANK